ncbi:hypothetical protein NQZ68_017205 [Dissostichus eleginoides]|uniref:Uncharacterized protein n=1 Tax=Champsocephalus esox TaxID=159716 RepID=A0AAN8CPQ6_9TELE|nr:hypothetical protein NQZ68_017205 [Dissostichus eleginoides]KAK5907652.1 hypothetical protein CesoFtcFv8_005474 [Champsocephalus esox]
MEDRGPLFVPAARGRAAGGSPSAVYFSRSARLHKSPADPPPILGPDPLRLHPGVLRHFLLTPVTSQALP